MPDHGCDSFEVFEQRRWSETAAAYDEHYTALTDQAIDRLLDTASVRGPLDVLDLACGPGTLAIRAALRGARVVGLDFAPEMIERARERGSEAVDFRVGDAERIDLPAACMDAVLMNFGLMHMARPERVVREVARVLRPGGRFGFTVWAPPEQSVASQIIGAAMALAEVPVAMPAGEPFYRFCDAEENRRVLGAAGFERDGVTLEALPLRWRFPRAEGLYELFAAATTRSALVLAAQPEATRLRIREVFTRGVSAWATDAGDFAVPHAAVLVTAARVAADRP